ncbi:hypothetical protein [uncultured Thiohalocapsa sp.]|uniref:hypothetical protein n=1 Tax=uncultured Thiohalocapsa sp. TaxID=768990 RepID=UPI0025E08307|nr:hypothetical protein [uncultured Thiohalocapsa sp.]
MAPPPTHGPSPHTRSPDKHRRQRRRTLTSLVHRLALLITLAIGGGALVYNAVSIVNGEGGLVRLPALSGAGWSGGTPAVSG